MNKLVSIVLNKVMVIALIINVVIVMVSQSNQISFELLLVINTIVTVYITNQKLDITKVIIVYLYAQLMVAIVTIVVVTQSLPISLIGILLTCYWIPRQIIKQLKPGSETKKNIAIALLINIVMTIVMWLLVLSVYYLTRTLVIASIDLNKASIGVMQISTMIGYIYVVTADNRKRKLGAVASGLYIVLVVALNIPFVILRPSGDIIEITECSQLSTLNSRGRYQLNTDLDCAGVPVSQIATTFYGEIISNGSTISNLELEGNYIERLSYNGQIEGINFENYSGSSIVGTSEGIIKGIEVTDSQITNSEPVGAITEVNKGQIEYIVIESSEVTGTNAVGAVSGVNKGTISGASIASDVQVSGNERVGTLVGLNEGTVDHSFSSGNIYNQGGELIDSNQRAYSNNYVGTLVGQQVDGASLKQSVYDGASYSNSIYREVGVQHSLEDRANRLNLCVEKNYQVNPTMTIGDYDQLVSAGGECEQEELDNGERRDNYIADNEFVYTAGDEYQVCVFTYYAKNKNTMPASFTPECGEDEKSLPPEPIRYQAYLRIWVGTEIYDLWHVDKPTSENYSKVQLQETISGELNDSADLGFGNCWNTSVYPPQLYPYGSEELCNISMS